MHATFKKLHPAFLSRSTVSVEKRLQLCRSILFTTGLFQAGTWPTLYTAELIRVHRAVMKIYSSIFGAGSDERVSHASISNNDMFVAPAIVIVFLRISLFIRICFRTPCQLFMTLSHAMGPTRSCMRSAANDLKFLAAKSASFADYGSSTLPEWVATVRQNPRAF